MTKKTGTSIKVNGSTNPVPMHQVNSSNLRYVGYEPSTKKLFVVFYSGAVYAYSPITEATYHELRNAESIGQYFFKHIRNNELVTTETIKIIMKVITK